MSCIRQWDRVRFGPPDQGGVNGSARFIAQDLTRLGMNFGSRRARVAIERPRVESGDQPAAALEGDVAPGPVERDRKAVLESRSENRCAPRSTAARRRSRRAGTCRIARWRACARWWRASRNRDSGRPAAVRPSLRAISARATYWPCCLATGATPGSGLPSASVAAAVSPMTKISGWPGTDRSARTFTRPARSVSACSQCPAGEAITPAAQMMVRVGIYSSPTLEAVAASNRSPPVRAGPRRRAVPASVAPSPTAPR